MFKIFHFPIKAPRLRWPAGSCGPRGNGTPGSGHVAAQTGSGKCCVELECRGHQGQSGPAPACRRQHEMYFNASHSLVCRSVLGPVLCPPLMSALAWLSSNTIIIITNYYNNLFDPNSSTSLVWFNYVTNRDYMDYQFSQHQAGSAYSESPGIIWLHWDQHGPPWKTGHQSALWILGFPRTSCLVTVWNVKKWYSAVWTGNHRSLDKSSLKTSIVNVFN